LVGKTYSREFFCVEGFPYKVYIEGIFIVMVYCMYSQHVTLLTFSLILTATYFSKGNSNIGDQLGTGLPTHMIVEKGHPVLWMSGNVVIEL